MSTDAPIQIDTVTIPAAEQTPLVLALVESIRRQDAEVRGISESDSGSSCGTKRITRTSRRPDCSSNSGNTALIFRPGK